MPSEHLHAASGDPAAHGAAADRVWDEPLSARAFVGSGRTPSRDEVRDIVADAVTGSG
ncbi:hypothetical protein GL263_24070 [Streptomyces durbertensis]|uniref:Uncharacterized protein n=1 Tax=Streptomyces durbertensis TaxID=2448886 RepID=A0ABR6EMN3_9ACTN|nr:hypothetical protein [Streptomyces durbertensis]MBB1246601.1 hypothetical protein [Streptomyces durbertensis]